MGASKTTVVTAYYLFVPFCKGSNNATQPLRGLEPIESLLGGNGHKEDAQQVVVNESKNRCGGNHR